MELNRINEILAQLAADPKNGRDHILSLSKALIEWMGYEWVENDRPRLLDFKTLKLKEALAPAPITGQEQIYRLTAEGQDVKIRLAVLKKFDKKIIQYIVDNHVGMISFQSPIGGVRYYEGQGPSITKYPYFVHFIATAKYDRLWVIFNIGEQKRVLVFRNRLSQTQYNKILPVWHNISAKPKPEMAKLFWSCLDVKEVNKDFYKLIKEQFDSLIGIAKLQAAGSDENMTKQFAVRLIGRYIFCWFLKEKGVISEKLLSSSTISGTTGFDKNVLAPLFFKTLNTPVADREITPSFNQINKGSDNIPYLNGGLFDWHPEDVLFEKLDLNDWLIAFVKVLEDFDFTVDESSSLYQQVAVDPEMLGRIFENLLASQNPDTEKMANQRKAFGAFYTPREIVDYMVNESLKAYLETHIMPTLPEQANVVNEPQVEYKGTLFQAMEPPPTLITFSDKSIAADIERRRERVKEHLDKLFAPGCTDNPFDKDETLKARKALSEITVLDPACGSGAFPMGVMLRLMELRQIVGHGHRNSYDLKEEILSRNIFGVDIMPMAVEISRLRAWLSLVLEADYRPTDRKNNFGIAALPNLDFKFVCANSLIDSGYDTFLENVHYNLTLYRLDGEIQKLETIRNNYFDPKGDKAKKTELQQEFLKTKNYVKTEFESLKKSWNLADFLNKVDDWNPFDDSHPSSFFSPAWMFGIRDGFDVVIGNPPYINISNLRPDSYREYLKSIFYSAKNKTDLYAFFIEAFINRLKEKGNLVFIVPHTWKATDSFSKFREVLFKRTKVNSIVNLEMGVFEAIVKPLIIHLTKTIDRNYSINVLNDRFNQTYSIPISEILKDNNLSVDTTSNNLQKRVFEKIENNSLTLEHIIQFSRGIKTSNDKRFVSIEKLNDEYHPVYRGKNIKAYKMNWNNEYIWYRPDLMKEKVGSVSYTKEFFEVKERIVTQRVNSSSQLLAAYDNEQNYFLDTVNVSRYESWDKETSLKYLCGILNSKLINFWYCNKYKMPTIGIYELHSIPIKNLTKEQQEPFIGIVEKILLIKKSNLDTTALEKEIDVLVYKLYELSYDEVKVVDPVFWLSEVEYENVKVE